MDQHERNRQRIAMVGSSGIPSRENMPLGVVIETEPEWECCCCDQDIPRPSGGFSTPSGSFCSECFVAYINHLFNGTEPRFLNAIRDETGYFISDRREEFESGALPLPNPVVTTLRDVTKGQVRRLLSKLGLDEDEDE